MSFDNDPRQQNAQNAAQQAQDESKQRGDTGVVQIKRKGGVVKDYMTVPLRIKNFWADESHKGWSIHTKILKMDEELVVVRCRIIDQQNLVRTTGHAEEIRGSSDINATSALENCETSAIGRALAALGLGGTSFASAEEVIGAQVKQEEFSVLKEFFKPLYERAAREGMVFLGDCWAKPSMLHKVAMPEEWVNPPNCTAIEVKRALKSELPKFKEIASKADNAAKATAEAEAKKDPALKAEKEGKK